MNRCLITALVACQLFASVLNGIAALEIPSIFSDHMVLQRDRPVTVWGWAAQGEVVTVEFAGKSANATASVDGRWEAVLPSFPASADGRDLTVRAKAGDSKTMTNVVVGDVWILGGQSNIGWTVGQSQGAAEAKARADYPWLRWFNQWPNQGAADAPARDVKGGRWQPVSSQMAAEVSAVGFYFAEALRPALKGVPVGLVSTSMGGTVIESWLDLPTLKALPGAKNALDAYQAALGDYDRRMEEWSLAKGQWEKAAEVARAKNQPPPKKDDFITNGPLGPHHFRRPSALFYGKVAPIQPFAARGVIWYQGEGNAANTKAASNYGSLLSTLIQRWRDGWRDPELFFLVAQLSGYDHPNGSADWPTLRAQQAEVVQNTPRAAMAVTIDVGDRTDIHPGRKQPVGERLALLARRHVYGEESVVAEAPRFVHAEQHGDEVMLHFKPAAELATSDGISPRGFEMGGEKQPFVEVEATLRDGAVVLSIPQGTPATEIRYAWANWPKANLQSLSGLPIAPFRINLPK
jgi:sialate O-acetylesterase